MIRNIKNKFLENLAQLAMGAGLGAMIGSLAGGKNGILSEGLEPDVFFLRGEGRFFLEVFSRLRSI